MDTTHELFKIAAFDRLEENTPRVYLRALADAFGSDARLGDLLLAATEAELEMRYEDMYCFEQVAEELATKIADSEQFEEFEGKSPARIMRSVELSLGTYHRVKDERAARERVTV